MAAWGHKLRGTIVRLGGVFCRRHAEEDFAAELEAHVQMQTDEGVRRGLTPEEARRQALIRMGGVEQVRQAHRERRTVAWMENVAQDLRYGTRKLRNSPGFTVTAVLTLALGIGANVSIFTVFDNVLLRNLPVRDPGRLVLLSEHSRFETGRLNINAGPSNLAFAYPAFQALRRSSGSLCELAAFSYGTAIATWNGDTNYVNMQLVSGDYFGLLGVRPVLGRTLTPADDEDYRANFVVVISQRYWHTRFGADPSILDRTMKLNGRDFTIVGVVPHDGVYRGAPAEIFLPLSLVSGGDLGDYTTLGRMNVLEDPLNSWMNIIGRLSPEITRAQAGTLLNTAWWNWRRDALEIAGDNILDKRGWLETHLTMVDGARGISLLASDFGEPLKVLQAMALLLLLIACANVANLLLARAARRAGELAVRGALGASRRRVFQQLAVEGLILGVIGATAGVAMGWLGLHVLLAAVPTDNSLHSMLITSVDAQALGICALAGMFTSVMFSLAPALLNVRIDLMSALHLQSHALIMGGGTLRRLLVTAEISLSFALIAGAAVFGWNLYRLANINPGFATSHVLTFTVDNGRIGQNEQAFRTDLTKIETALNGLPGASRATYAAFGLISGWSSGGNITIAGSAASKTENPVPDRNWVSPDFFSTLQIPLLAGRVFTAADTASAQKVAIVDEAFVRSFFKGDTRSALDGVFGFGGGDRVKMDFHIVGVIPTVRATSLESAPSVPFVYLPYAQPYGKNPSSPASFYVRATGDPSRLAVAVRTIVHQSDPDLIVGGLETMQEHLSDVTYAPRLVTVLSLLMGGLALLLAGLGLQGLLMLAVSQRTREFGIRIALGADRGRILKVVIALVSRVVLPGMAVGALLGWAGIRELAHFDANLMQPPWWVFLSTGPLLAGAMAAASYVPVRHATSVDPTRALRAE